MKVLLTFTGSHDPFGDTCIDGQQEVGPVLTVVSDRHFDLVVLFGTPAMRDATERTKAEIASRHPRTAVQLLDIPLRDPTNHMAVLCLIRKHWQDLNSEHPDADVSICLTSGTPHMHAVWLLLVAGGEIPAKLLQTRAQKFVTEHCPAVTEIDISDPSFPEIRSMPTAAEVGVDLDLSAVCARLGIVGQNGSFLRALEQTATLGRYGQHVLVLGETGTGKELFANLVHAIGSRSNRPVVCVNCAGLNENLIESELFGHTKGAFTGATVATKGKFENANGGVLFLDELGELPVSSQAKLLRAIDKGEIEPLGSGRQLQVDVQVVAATNRDVRKAIREGEFRQDLYHRFGGTVSIPSLRDRREDIPLLARHALDIWNATHESGRRLSAPALQRLSAYSWPGNVRELIRVVQSAAMMTKGKVIGPGDLPIDTHLSSDNLDLLPDPHEGFQLNEYCAEVRKRLLVKALKMSGGNMAAAARLLGVTPQAVSQHYRRKG